MFDWRSGGLAPPHCVAQSANPVNPVKDICNQGTCCELLPSDVGFRSTSLPFSLSDYLAL